MAERGDSPSGLIQQYNEGNVLEMWIASGDETGGWDIVDGRFGTGFTGIAWVLGPLSVWESALQMPLGNTTALAAFSQPFSSRLPDGVQLSKDSQKYHLMDVWAYCKNRGLRADVALDAPQDDPVLELLRRDAEWLLQKSGLGVLTAGGNSADGKAAGLGISGDGLRERARAFAALMTVALPFIPGDASLTLLAEGRTEASIADAAKYNLFPEVANDTRLHEPYRNFIGHLTEDLARASTRCGSFVADGRVVSEIVCRGSKGKNGLADLIGKHCRLPLRAHALEAVAAMKGIADLGAALMPQPDSVGCRLVVPPAYSANHWFANFRELRNAIHG